MAFRFLCRPAFRRTAGTAPQRRVYDYLLVPSSSFLDQSPSGDQFDHSTICKRWHVGHSHHHHLGTEVGQEGDRVFKLGLASDIALATGKALTGYVSGSTAILADAAHSVSDVVLSGVALLSFRAGRVPRDREHPYGHGKFESLGALGVSCMLLVTAGGIAWHALDILYGLLTSPDIGPSVMHKHGNNHAHSGHHHGIDLEHPFLALGMTITSIAVKEGLYRITKRVGDKDGSGLMKANAWHHRADAISSLVALVGVGGAIIGVPFLDPLAGLLVSSMIMKAGIESGHQSVMELVDAGVPVSDLVQIKKTILKVEGVKGCHDLRGRRAGSSLHLDVHIEVDPFLSVSMAHDIGENVRKSIKTSHSNVAEIHIHIDPSAPEFHNAIPRQGKNLKCLGTPTTIFSREQDHEALIPNILSTKFSEKIQVERITRHSLQGKVFLLIQVSMPSDMFIRDAMDMAKDAEHEILIADSSINQVSIQLRLGQPTPH